MMHKTLFTNFSTISPCIRKPPPEGYKSVLFSLTHSFGSRSLNCYYGPSDMLSPRERLQATELLNGLPLDDVLNLAKTITNGNLNPSTKEEAIDAITSYEEDIRSLLNRKKITKTILFSYLHWKKSHQSVNADKVTLVEAVVDLWTSSLDPSSESSKSVAIISSNSAVKKLNRIHETDTAVDAAGCATKEQVELMALKFSEWFYQLVNEDFVKKGGPILSEADFWKDCNVSVKITNGVDSETFEACSNGEAVVTVRGIATTHKLFFSPNLTKSGIKGKLEPHGIVLIVVCGTLHQGAGECVGIFEQSFSLIKDPLSSDNWKIKSTDLRLKTQSNVQEPPSLENGEFGPLVG